MRFRTTLYLFLAVCALGAFIFLLDQRRSARGPLAEAGSPVLSMPGDSIRSLRIERGDFFAVLEREDGTWYLRRPASAIANEAVVDHLLATLEEAGCQEVVTPEQRLQRGLSLEDYGLTSPSGRIVIASDALRDELLLGNPSPVGELVYARHTSSENVLAVPVRLFSMLPRSVAVLRDRHVIRGDPFRTERFEIQPPLGGFTQLIRHEQGAWMLHQPVMYRADAQKVIALLSALYEAEVIDYVWDPGPGAARDEPPTELARDEEGRLEAYRLATDTATARVRVWEIGDEVGKELVFGKTADEPGGALYAKRTGDDTIFTVTRGLLDRLSVTANDLKDRRVFSLDPGEVRYARFIRDDRKLVLKWDFAGGWSLADPVTWKADDVVVSDVLEGVAGLRVMSFVADPPDDLGALGLETPAWAIDLAPDCPPATKPPSGAGGVSDAGESPGSDQPAPGIERVIIGSPVPGEDARYGRLAGSAVVFQLDAADLERSGANPADPLVFHDRTVLAVASDKVRRVALERDGVEQSVGRGGDDVWLALEPEGSAVRLAALDEVLFTVANLRAERIAVQNPEDLTSFGLDQPEMALRLGLSGEEGIQKSILLGNRSILGGRYAIVQGQDIVFVLDGAQVERLTLDLVSPLPTSTELPSPE